MHFATLLLSFGLAAQARPAVSQAPRAVDDGVEILLFDAPAFLDPADSSNTLVNMQVFAFETPIDTSKLGDILSTVLSPLAIFGIDIGDAIETALDRVRLAAAVGKGGQSVTVDISGCSQPAIMSTETSVSPDNGLALQNVSVGTCTQSSQLDGQLSGAIDISSIIFPSVDTGFGVISDIDDTIKVSNVLDKLKLIKATLFDEPKAVTGMPDLYASLAQTLDDPNFFYITGSPYQLFPFLRDFVATSFPETRGPIFAKNLTLSDIGDIVGFLFEDDNTFNFKLGEIDRVHGMFPNKKFLTVGDSTEQDPEIYGAAFRKYGGDFIQCIWVRAVEDADNSDERFAAAFEGVPETKFRVYSDDDIINVLPTIDVANGAC